MPKNINLFLLFVILFVLFVCAPLLVAYAEYSTVKMTVPAQYACRIEGFDLHCFTNAQHVFINGKEVE